MFPATTYSPALVSRAVPSARAGLTSEFGMGSGVTSMPLSPENNGEFKPKTMSIGKIKID